MSIFSVTAQSGTSVALLWDCRCCSSTSASRRARPATTSTTTKKSRSRVVVVPSSVEWVLPPLDGSGAAPRSGKFVNKAENLHIR